MLAFSLQGHIVLRSQLDRAFDAPAARDLDVSTATFNHALAKMQKSMLQSSDVCVR